MAVARALAGEPRLILADEPTGQLDRASGAAVIDVLLAAADHSGAALVVTTHDPTVADRLPERWEMSDGRLTTTLQPGELMLTFTWLRGLLARRRSRLVATALGVAVGVALLASIGTFLSSTTSKMTERAVGRVAVDWQVETQTGAVAGRRAQDHPGVPRRAHGAPGELRVHHRPQRELRRLDADHRTGGRSSVCPATTRAPSRARSAPSRAPDRACCSPSRRRPTSTRRRATS